MFGFSKSYVLSKGHEFGVGMCSPDLLVQNPTFQLLGSYEVVLFCKFELLSLGVWGSKLRTFDALWEPSWNFEYDEARPQIFRRALSSPETPLN